MTKEQQKVLKEMKKQDKKREKGLKKLAKAGDPAALVEIATLLYRRKNTPKNRQKAVEMYEKAALQNYGAAQFFMGLSYLEGIGVEKDAEKAAAWFAKACAHEDAETQYEVGYCHQSNGFLDSDKTAAEQYKKAAEQGHVVAQYRLGWYYANGYGVEQDYDKAVYWLTQSAEKGDRFAQYELGLLYKEGKGVAVNPEKAAELFKLSAKQGCDNAQYEMGICYRDGFGVAQDSDKAKMWFYRAKLWLPQAEDAFYAMFD